MNFNSKILVFGEYAALHGSDALLVPFSRFSGRLDFMGSNPISIEIESNESLKKLYNFLITSEVSKHFNRNTLKSDIDSGLYFNSSIPIGYGVGSSGALVAALFHSYSDLTINNNLGDLKQKFAILESFFHGSSSGLDPLVSFVNRGFLLDKSSLNYIDVDLNTFNPFFIDMGKTRTTSELVKIFNSKCSNSNYLFQIKNKLVNYNSQIIKALINNDSDEFYSTLKLISAFQLDHFREMMMDKFDPIWRLGLETDKYYLKLNGAGGGGFILGFARDIDYLRKISKDNALNLVEILF